MNIDSNTRLDQLESRLRRQQWISLFSLILAGAAVGLYSLNRSGAARSGTTVEASRFVLRDAKGDQRGVWEVSTEDEAALRIGRREPYSAFIGESSEGPGVSLFHPSGTGRAFLQAHQDSAEVYGQGASREGFRVGTNGSQLSLSHGTAVVESGANATGPWMTMTCDGKSRLALGKYDLTGDTWRLRFLNPDNTVFHETPPAAPPP